MRRVAVVFLGAVTLLTTAASASAVTLKTNWVERTELSSRTPRAMQIQYGLVKDGPRTTLAHGPAKLPRDRLLRVGFGFLIRTDGQYNTELSTTHQFKLPRRL